MLLIVSSIQLVSTQSAKFDKAGKDLMNKDAQLTVVEKVRFVLH
jgi:hypothetical protein